MPTVNYNGKTVSDKILRTTLQSIADSLGASINITSGDRNVALSMGGKKKSLHLAHLAADFHAANISDTQIFDHLKAHLNDIFDHGEAYEIIHHGPYTETTGPHIHVGRYPGSKPPGGYFKNEGLTPAGKGHYPVNFVAFTNSKGVTVPPSVTKGGNVDVAVTSISVGVGQSVGTGGVNIPGDVLLVQSLLNKALKKLHAAKIPFQDFRPLVEDRICGPKTIQAISIFQRDILKLNPPDGRVDPGGRTIRALYVAVYSTMDKIVPRTNRVKTAPPIHKKTGGGGSSASAQELVKNPRIKAMLEVLALSEGTSNAYGRIVFGTVKQAPFNPEWIGKHSRRDNRDGVIVTDFSRHPQVLVELYAGQPSKDWSSASGRYQFLSKTWRGLNLPSFEPQWQDIGCVMLFQSARMIDPLLSGNFDEAVQRGCPVWASLPDANKGGASHYGGQPSVPLARLREVYNTNLKNFGG